MVYIYSLVGRVFVNCPGDLGSIPGRVILMTLKMVLDTSLHNTQQYKVRIKGKMCIILICMQKHSQHNKDERTQFFRKIYHSHFIRNGTKGLRKGYA